MKNSSIDLFNTISENMEPQTWELFTSEIINMNYEITLNRLVQLLTNFTNENLTSQQMTFIFESYKVHRELEDNPAEMGERLVNVKDLVSARIKRKNKRIDDVIAIHKERI